MLTFVSRYNGFEINLPEGWRHTFEHNVYSFFNESEKQGVLQISKYFHEREEKFDLMKEEKKHPDAQAIDLSEYGAIHYSLESKPEKMLHYYWITGYDHVKLFCSLTVEAQLGPAKIAEAYATALMILNTLKIHNTHHEEA